MPWVKHTKQHPTLIYSGCVTLPVSHNLDDRFYMSFLGLAVELQLAIIHRIDFAVDIINLQQVWATQATSILIETFIPDPYTFPFPD